MILNLLFTYAGFLLLFETNGDPWIAYNDRLVQDHNFFVYVYLAIVTGSTVGYGEIVAKTTLGRLSTMIYILTAIVIIPLGTNRLFGLLTEIPKTRGNKINYFRGFFFFFF